MSSPPVPSAAWLTQRWARVCRDHFDFFLLNPSPTNVIADSTQPLMGKVHCSLPAWDKLQILLWGHVQVFNMVIAPQFKYACSLLPCWCPGKALSCFTLLCCQGKGRCGAWYMGTPLRCPTAAL